MSRTFLPLCTVDQRFGESKMQDAWFGGCWAERRQGHGSKSKGIPRTHAHWSWAPPPPRSWNAGRTCPLQAGDWRNPSAESDQPRRRDLKTLKSGLPGKWFRWIVLHWSSQLLYHTLALSTFISFFALAWKGSQGFRDVWRKCLTWKVDTKMNKQKKAT